MGQFRCNISFNQEVLESTTRGGVEKGAADSAASSVSLNEDEQKAILELFKNPKITYDQLAQELGVSRRTAARTLASLVEKEQIERIGSNRTGYWKILR